MPIATHVLSGDFSGLVGEVTSIRATINTNSADGGWVNDTDNLIALGGTVLAVGADGKFAITLPTSTDTDLQYQVTAVFTDFQGDRSTRKTWESGWFTLTGNSDLADLANDSSLRVNTTLGAQLAARIDGYVDHGNVSGAVTFTGPTGSHWFDATAATTITLAGFSEGQVVSLLPFSGAADVTLADLPDLDLTDGIVTSAMLARGSWITGGGSSAPTDTTPPSNVTGLTATGGAGTLTASWTASTDTETSVSYRYRYWLTSGGATGTWTTTTATSFTVASGVPAGAYTVQVYAFSAGGQQTTPTSATATVTAPAGWSTVLDDTFTGTDNTPIAGRTVGASTWTDSSGKAEIQSNMLALDQTVTTTATDLTVTTPAASGTNGYEVWTYYTFASTGTVAPIVKLTWAGSPEIRFGAHWNGTTFETRAWIKGYNASSVYGDLVLPVSVRTATDGAGKFGVRKTGDVYELLHDDGTVVATHTVLYSGYVGQTSPGTLNISLTDYQNCKIDRVTVEALS